MSNRNSRGSAASRAEARRRARHQALGRDPDEGDEDEPAPERAAGPSGGFLTRIFPPAPPLPGKPDPLAGFSYAGPLRGVVAAGYLLSRRPLVWGAAGVGWAVARMLSELAGSSLGGVVVSLFLFGSLIAAGWIGWQRPWLYGLAAGILGVLVYAGIWTVLFNDAPDVPYQGATLFLFFLSREAFQPLFGALAGWYGGYLRRRLAAAPAQVRSSRRR